MFPRSVLFEYDPDDAAGTVTVNATITMSDGTVHTEAAIVPMAVAEMAATAMIALAGEHTSELVMVPDDAEALT